MSVLNQLLLKHLKSQFSPYQPKRIIIGYSGGVDSHVLLHLVQQAFADSKVIVSAIHVNHQLQPQADTWQQHCEQVCQQLGVAIISEKIITKPQKGESLEAFARNARYQLIKDHLQIGDIFISGHHQGDQAETFLLQLMRGAGLDGLKSMPVAKPLGKGIYIRPLLSIAKSQINDYAGAHQLPYIEDPSNQDIRFSRNFLRQEVMPLLQSHWPQAQQSIAQSAQWLSEVAITSDNIQKLIINDLKSQDTIVQKQAIRDFFKNKSSAIILSQKQLAYIQRHFFNASVDKHPELVLGDFIVRRLYGEIVLTKAPIELSQQQISIGEEVELSQLGTLQWLQGEGLNLPKGTKLIVKPVNLQDRFHPHDRGHSQTVKKLLLEYRIPYWLRVVTPAFYVDNELVAVAGVGVAKSHYKKSVDCFMPQWKIKQFFVSI